MKIAITGHTSGLGEAIYDHFAPFHEVIGLSRSTGFDLSGDVQKAVDVIKTCDIFFNNAHLGTLQAKLLLQLFKHLPIVTSGSMAADYPTRNQYCANKMVIEKTFKGCRVNTPHPMLLLKMGYLENHPDKNPIPYTQVLDAIDFWLHAPRVSVIQFDNRSM